MQGDVSEHDDGGDADDGDNAMRCRSESQRPPLAPSCKLRLVKSRARIRPSTVAAATRRVARELEENHVTSELDNELDDEGRIRVVNNKSYAAEDKEEQRESSPFSWIKRRLNEEHDLDEFERLEQTVPLQPSQSSHTSNINQSSLKSVSFFSPSESSNDPVFDADTRRIEDSQNHTLQAHEGFERSSLSPSMTHHQNDVKNDCELVDGGDGSCTGSDNDNTRGDCDDKFVHVDDESDVREPFGNVSLNPSKPSLLVQKFFTSSASLGKRKKNSVRRTKPRSAATNAEHIDLRAQTQQALKRIEELECVCATIRAENARLTTSENAAKRRCRGLEKDLREANIRCKTGSDDVQRERALIESERQLHIKRMRKQRLELDKHVKSVLSSHLPDRNIRDQLNTCQEELAKFRSRTEVNTAKLKSELSRVKRELQGCRSTNLELAEDLRVAEQNRLEQWQHSERIQADLVRARQLLRQPSNSNAIHHTIQDEQVVDQQIRSCTGGSATSSEYYGGHHSKKSSSKETQQRNSSSSSIPINDKLSHTEVIEESQYERSPQRIAQPGGKIETRYADGRRVVDFANGTKKVINVDGSVDISFVNGDRKKVLSDREEYFYSSSDILHVTYSDGIQVFDFGNRQKETHYTDGSKKIVFADNIVKHVFANGDERSVFPNGLVQRVTQGKVSIEYPDDSTASNTNPNNIL